MALLFMDSADTYNTQAELLAKWGMVNAPSGSTITIGSPGRSGSGNYIGLNNTNGNQTGPLFPIPALGSLVVCGGYEPAGSSLILTGPLGIFAFYDVSGNPMCFLQTNVDLSVSLTVPSTGIVATSPPNLVTLQSWNFVECTLSFATGATGTLTVKVNGIAAISASSIITSHTTTACYAAGPFTTTNAGANFDDIYILSTSGAPTASLGDCKIVALMPNGAGRLTQFNKFGAATNFGAVNEVPPDGDTSYVYDATTGIVDCYTLPVPPNVLSLLAVQPFAYARKDETPSKVLALGVGNGTTESYDAGHGLTQSYVYYLDPLGTNPLTSAPWAPSDLATLQFAQKVTT